MKSLFRLKLKTLQMNYPVKMYPGLHHEERGLRVRCLNYSEKPVISRNGLALLLDKLPYRL